MQQLTKTHTPFFAVFFMANVILLALSRANRWLWSLLYLDLRRGKFVASFWRANALATFTGFSCVWGRTISNLTLATQRHFNEPPVEATLFFYSCCFLPLMPNSNFGRKNANFSWVTDAKVAYSWCRYKKP